MKLLFFHKKREEGKSPPLRDLFVFFLLFLLAAPYNTDARESDYTFHPKYNNFISHYSAYKKAADKRDFRAALLSGEKALELAKKVFGDDSQTTGLMYDRLGYAESATGNYDRAIELFNNSLGIYKKIFGGNHENTASVYINIGEAFRGKGDINRALEFHSAALRIYQKKLGDHHTYVGTACNFIGGAYKSKGDYDRAIEYYNKALEIYINNLGENHQYVATTYVNLGGAHEPKGDYAKSVEYYLKAISIYKNTIASDHPFVAVTYNNLGLGYYFLNNKSEAIRYYNSALEIYLKTLGNKHPHTAYTYINLGLAYRSDNNIPMALSCYNKALEILKQNSDRNGYLRILSHLGDLYAREKKFSRAASYYEKGVKLILKYRLEIGRGKSGFLGRYVFMFDRLIDIRLLLNEPEKAFYADCMKKGLSITEDMTLKQALVKGQISKKDQSLLVSLINRVRMLESERSVLINEGKEDEGGKLLREIWAREKEKDIFDQGLMKKYPAYAALRSPSVPPVSELMKGLSRGEMLVSYSLNDERSMAFVVSRDQGLVCVPLNIKSGSYHVIAEEARNIHSLYKYSANETVFTDIRTPSGERTLWNRKKEKNRYRVLGSNIYTSENVRQKSNDISLLEGDMSLKKINVGSVRGEISGREIETLREELCRNLYSRVITPLNKHIEKAKKIIIIPDGPLFYVPLGLLKDLNGEMLSAHARIVLVHSPTVWLRIKQKQENIADLPLLAVGNAVYNRNHSTLGAIQRGITRSSGNRIINRSFYHNKSANNPIPVYNNLHGTADEIHAITLAAYGKTKSSKHLLQGINANEDLIFRMSHRGELGRYRVIHFAAHGLFSDREPSLNAIVLSIPGIVKQYRRREYQSYAARYGGFKGDGFLRLGEIKTLDINCDLVVMSACETSMGHFLHGEGMVGLPQAFLIAGSQAVVASLWPVDDEAAFILMEEFYRNIFNKAMKPVDALHFARETLKEEYSDPYYWAPFVIYGR